jgi:bifunctional polynucleotide phosphatase/kinase
MECYIFPNKYISNKVAAFDLDGTLICTKSKRRFPKDKDDWKIINEFVKPKLQKLHENKYCIIVFTNQKNLEKRMKKKDFKEKCMNIQNALEVPIVFYVSLCNDYMRKPFPGMFEYHNKQFCSAIINQISFYVGDAWSKTKSFSDSDLCFAKNCQLPFYKASEFFINDNPSPYDISIFPSRKIDENFVTNQIKLSKFIMDKKYIFVISSPASGKTTFCEKYLPDYVRLSKDDFKTASRYRNIIKQNLDNKIVFDNTNSRFSTRQKILSFLDDTSEVGYIIRNIPKNEAFYLNKYRHFISYGKIKLLPDVAIYTFYKNVEFPTGENVFTIDSSWIGKLKDFYC